MYDSETNCLRCRRTATFRSPMVMSTACSRSLKSQEASTYAPVRSLELHGNGTNAGPKQDLHGTKIGPKKPIIGHQHTRPRNAPISMIRIPFCRTFKDLQMLLNNIFLAHFGFFVGDCCFLMAMSYLITCMRTSLFFRDTFKTIIALLSTNYGSRSLLVTAHD